jgi:hypothetical protein
MQVLVKVCVWTYLDECLVNSCFDKWCVWTDLDIACIYEGFLVNVGFVDYLGCVWDCDFVNNKCDFKPNRRT